VRVHTAESLEQARAAIAELPAALRQVIVLRDVEGRARGEVRRALNLSPDQERAMVHQARSLVRARLEGFFEQTGSGDAR
jgi:RNA polymerase sigma-70 factor, ECF subfamily